MAVVRRSPQAETDLETILEDLQQNNPAVAERYATEPAPSSQDRTTSAANSGPLSLRTRCGGPPRSAATPTKMTRISSAVMLRRASNARHSRVYSSTRLSHFKLRPSLVRSKIKSHVHTSSFPRDGRRWHVFASCPCGRRGLGVARGLAIFSPDRRHSRRT